MMQPLNTLFLGLTALLAVLPSTTVSVALPQPQGGILPRPTLPRLPPGVSPGSSSGYIQCGNDFFSPAAQTAATQKGITLHNAGETRGKNKYPHQFRNLEGLPFTGACWAAAQLGNLQEYPIMADGSVYDGGKNNVNVGPHRVVFAPILGRPLFCNLITHIGAPNPNGFVMCNSVEVV